MSAHLHITALTVLLGCLAMTAKDGLGVFMVVAENRGRALLAGVMDGASDLAVVLVNVVGAGAVLTQGWTMATIVVLAAMMATSVVGTTFWTRAAQHIDLPRDPLLAGALARIAALEHALSALGAPPPAPGV